MASAARRRGIIADINVTPLVDIMLVLLIIFMVTATYIVRACLAHAADGPAAVEERKAGAIERERGRYERRLAFLGTLGNNAPFIGLFGTVLGIIRAFHDLSLQTAGGAPLVMTGISQALVATGIGLIVALPAVATYNAFTRHVERATSAAEVLAHEILAILKTTPEAGGPGAGRGTTDAESA